MCSLFSPRFRCYGWRLCPLHSAPLSCYGCIREWGWVRYRLSTKAACFQHKRQITVWRLFTLECGACLHRSRATFCLVLMSLCNSQEKMAVCACSSFDLTLTLVSPNYWWLRRYEAKPSHRCQGRMFALKTRVAGVETRGSLACVAVSRNWFLFYSRCRTACGAFTALSDFRFFLPRCRIQSS